MAYSLKSILKLFTVYIFMLVAGCELNPYKNHPILGTWRLVLLNEDGVSRILQPNESECPDCFIVTFNEDGTLEGRSYVNLLMCYYGIKPNKEIKFNGVKGTSALEIGDPHDFTDTMDKVTNFVIDGNFLFLYYPDNSYLLFARK